MKDHPLSVAALGLASVLICNGAHAAAFFDIELGAPFSMRECVAGDFGTFDRPINLCTTMREKTVHPWGSVTHSVHLVGSADQRGINEIFVTEYKDVVVKMRAVTYGEPSQGQVLLDLITKFGPATTGARVPVEDAFRARYVKIVANWNKPGFTVKFRGTADSRNDGEIIVSTKQALEESRAGDAWRAKNRPSKM